MKRLSLILLAVLLLASGVTSAPAQDKYPSRPVKVIVPYAPGGATDIVARVIGDQFQKITGQPFVVVNKPGAFGMLAIDEMAKSAPDGYTLMIGNVSTNAITPVIYASKMSVDYGKSVVAVTRLVDVPAFLLVTAANDFPPKTVAEFIDYAKKNPGKLRYGTVGIGSYPHYDMAYFAKRAGDLDISQSAEQERRLRRDPGSAARRRAGRLPQRRLHRRHGEGRQDPPARGGQSHAAQGLSGYPDHAQKQALPASARWPGKAYSRRRQRRSRCWTRCLQP